MNSSGGDEDDNFLITYCREIVEDEAMTIAEKLTALAELRKPTSDNVTPLSEEMFMKFKKRLLRVSSDGARYDPLALVLGGALDSKTVSKSVWRLF